MEQTILLAIQKYFGASFLVQISQFLGWIGEHGEVWIFFLLLLLCFKRTRKIALLGLVSLLIEFILVNIMLKPLFHRPRPCMVYPVFLKGNFCPQDYSWPSGHSASAFAVAGVFLWSHAKYRYWVTTFALMMAFSRMVIYVHWPSDILSGIGIGLGISYFVVFSKPFKRFPGINA
ncbi:MULTISPECIES: phosphatase PAP2 family protein [Terrabacteria group]|uniref:phosphatase PAP2 family protein n=1 Tax=Bacillati TaxID=1783272 RepID=UPI001939A58E|nr:MULTISPECIES: phosphatase PAP2 family protein [Terrabacteria group]MBW9213002.1 phosphatase PAP2 family protein [Trueperella sp. zg.1013]QRG87044.1 phosphatase PAP2 family protein [Bulleidia sp. zg-1006]